MELLYTFNMLGIIYTAVVGGLALLILIALLRLAIAKKPCTPGTVIYRILNIVLIVVLLAVWCVYLLSKIELFGVSFGAQGENLALNYDGSPIFEVPFVGGLVNIFGTILGTILLGVASLLAIVSLVLSFACRKPYPPIIIISERDNPEEYARIVAEMETEKALRNANKIEVEPVEQAESVPAVETQTIVASEKEESAPALAKNLEPESAINEVKEEAIHAIVVEDIKDEQAEITPISAPEVISKPETVTDEVVAVSEPEIVTDEVVAVSEPVIVSDEAVAVSEPEIVTDEVVAVSEPVIDSDEAVAVSTEEIAPQAEPIDEKEIAPQAEPIIEKRETVEVRKPLVEYVEVSRLGGNVSGKTYSSSLKKPETKKKTEVSNADGEVKGEFLAVQKPPLPVTRKLVITNRMNVVNMFNIYLNEKEKEEREKLSGNIGKIIIK